MRIGLFTHVYPPMVNGISVSTKSLEEELRKQGHDVFVITNNYDEFNNDFVNLEKIKVISIPIYYQNLRTPILYNPDLFRQIDKLNLDVIHSHSDFGIGLLSRLYALKNNKPHIQTYHCNYVEYANSNFGQVLGRLSKIPVRLYTQYLSSTTNRLIAPSEENFRFLTEEFKLKRDIDLIPNGIDLSKFRDVNLLKVDYLKNKYNILDDDFVLLCLSRLSKEKRIEEIIKIVPHLKDCPKLKLLIVGGGPDEKNLKKLVNDLKLDNVIFTSEIANEDIAYYYRLGTAFITNSIAETQGLTVIEALASSIPVICVNSPLYDKVVENGKNGIKYSNMSELVKVLSQLYNNREYIERMRKYTELSVFKYSIEHSTKKIVNIYDDEISKKNLYGR